MRAIAHGQSTHNSWLSRHIHAMRGSVARTMEHTDTLETRGLHPAYRYLQGYSSAALHGTHRRQAQ
jgi:hypothetical protein